MNAFSPLLCLPLCHAGDTQGETQAATGSQLELEACISSIL